MMPQDDREAGAKVEEVVLIQRSGGAVEIEPTKQTTMTRPLLSPPTK